MKDFKPPLTLRLDRMTRIGLALAVLILLAACNVTPTPALEWSALPDAPAAEILNQLSPTWDNQVGESLDLLVYIETTCRQEDCKRFFSDTLPFLTASNRIHLRIYDYPLSQKAESLMVAGIGRCLAQSSPSVYLAWLREAGASALIEDELEMMRISKQVSGKYDSDCLRVEIKKIKAIFENQNPLNLTQTPAMVLNGKLLYGYRTQGQWASLFESVMP